MASYAFGTVIDGDFLEVIDRVTGALAEEGFGVLTSIDVRATMKAKLDVDLDPYVILGACNPPLAHQAITADPAIGALLPCNVVVRQVGDRIAIDFMDPKAVLTLVDHPDVPALADEVRSRLARVVSRL